jgi:hypothetical protein
MALLAIEQICLPWISVRSLSVSDVSLRVRNSIQPLPLADGLLPRLLFPDLLRLRGRQRLGLIALK